MKSISTTFWGVGEGCHLPLRFVAAVAATLLLLALSKWNHNSHQTIPGRSLHYHCPLALHLTVPVPPKWQRAQWTFHCTCGFSLSDLPCTYPTCVFLLHNTRRMCSFTNLRLFWECCTTKSVFKIYLIAFLFLWLWVRSSWKFSVLQNQDFL